MGYLDLINLLRRVLRYLQIINQLGAALLSFGRGNILPLHPVNAILMPSLKTQEEVEMGGINRHAITYHKQQQYQEQDLPDRLCPPYS